METTEAASNSVSILNQLSYVHYSKIRNDVNTRFFLPSQTSSMSESTEEINVVDQDVSLRAHF